jgi:hypothetical protein
MGWHNRKAFAILAPVRGIRPRDERKPMAVYKCEKCGMSVGSITCGKCGKELVHDTLKLDDGRSVTISKCPEGHGKIKSPQCCGADMTCSV